MPNSVNEGFSILFNENMDTNFDVAHRSSTADHFAFTHEASSSSYLLGPFNPTPDIYDHPIAVLTGPACISAGDYTGFQTSISSYVPLFWEKDKYSACGWILCEGDPRKESMVAGNLQGNSLLA